MVVLSLFDGIACARLALERAGLNVSKYYASEVDKHAIKVAKKNWPGIIHVGSVKDWRVWDIESPDLIIAGSPCQGFSSAGANLNFEDPRSALFFDFVDVLNHYKPKNFILENVKMHKDHETRISKLLGCKPIEINSALVSAQNRRRLYWTSIKTSQPSDRAILLNDVLEDGYGLKTKSDAIVATIYKETVQSMVSRKKNGLLVRCMHGFDRYELEATPVHQENNTARNDHADSNYLSFDMTPVVQRSKETGTVVLYGCDAIRKFTPVECERLQTIPDGYTEGISKSQRLKAIGNGFTVDVIAHILKGLKNVQS